jgi:branched-chain amino acid aminotransferase
MRDNEKRMVYINGEMVPEDQAKISVFDIGRLYGVTMYESIRTFNHRFFKLDKHLDRLESSLSYIGLPGLVARDEMETVLQKTLDANLHLCEEGDDLWVCIEVTPGDAFPMPLKSRPVENPTVLCYSSEIPFASFVEDYTRGKHVVTALPRNIPPQCYEQRCKNRSRLPHFMSKLWAAKVDPKAFALMLDVEGFLTEGTGANLFLVRDGALLTPTTRNILNGVSRQYVIALAGELGIEVRECDLTVYDAYAAREAFWTTSSYCILPISRFDGRPVGDGNCPGPMASRLLDAWSQRVGVDILEQARRFANR